MAVFGWTRNQLENRSCDSMAQLGLASKHPDKYAGGEFGVVMKETAAFLKMPFNVRLVCIVKFPTAPRSPLTRGVNQQDGDLIHWSEGSNDG